jgi:serine/threonine-protein kinase
MSPEQAAGDQVLDQRSDLYSLGAVAYHLLTGRPPFNGVGGLAVLVAHARDPVVPPSLVLPGIPEDLERVVLRCLAKDVADRFADAESLERALRECACSGDWNQDHAAGWWRDAARISPPHTTAAAS